LFEKLAGPAPVVEEEPESTDADPSRVGDASAIAEPKTLDLVEEASQEDIKLRKYLDQIKNRPWVPLTDQEITDILKAIGKVKDRSSSATDSDMLKLAVKRWGGAAKHWSDLAQDIKQVSFPDSLYVWFADWSLRSLPFDREVQVGRLGPDQAWLAPVLSCEDAVAARQLQNLVAALLGVYLPAQQAAAIETAAPAVPEHRRNWLLWALLGTRAR